MQVLWGVGGGVALLLVAVAMSTDRRAIRPRTVLGALALQVLLAVLVLYVPLGQRALTSVSGGVQAVIDSSRAGIDFVFGPVLPEEGVVFAFQVLPVIVFFAALTSVLYHLGILQRVVAVVGGGLSALLGTTRAESMSAGANIFVGQTEAPLVVRPYLGRMSRSEFFAVMTGGLASVAGSVLVGYSLLGAELEYLIAASFMAAPGGLAMAKILVPEPRETPEEPVTAPDDDAADDDTADDDADDAEDDAAEDGEVRHRNVIDAAASGASDGLRLTLNVGAMLIAFISLIALLNLLLGRGGELVGVEDLTFEKILGTVFAPVMAAVGVPWAEAAQAGSFLGQKVILNEFVAFADFAPQIDDFSTKTQVVVTFALTGFANLGSLAILLGGLGTLVPERRSEIASLGLRAVLGGTLANLMSATIAGALLG